MSYGADEFEMLVSHPRETLESSRAFGAQLQVRAIRDPCGDEASARCRSAATTGGQAARGGAEGTHETRADEW